MFRLALTMEAVCRFEVRTGQSMFALTPDLEVIRSLLWALLITEHPDMTEQSVGAIVAPETLAYVMRQIQILFTSGLPAHEADTELGSAEPKPTDWYEVEAMARFDLRLTPAEFWALSPLQFHHLCKRLDDQHERHFLAAGIVAAAITNCHIDREKSEPLTPYMFMPTRSGERERRKLATEHSSNLTAKLAGAMRMLGAKIIPKPA